MKNIRQLLEHWVGLQPEKTFLFSEHDGGEFAYGAFDEHVNRTANLLLGLGVGKGNTLSLFLPNLPEYLFFYFACWKIGARAGPVNYLLKSEEIDYVVNNSEASVVVTDEEGWRQVEPILDRLRQVRSVILLDRALSGTVHYRHAVESESSVLALTDIQPDDEAIVIYTSGTTGRPKGCLLTHRNLLTNARQIADWLCFTPADRLFCVMPLFHMNALAVTTMTPLHAGASMVLSRKFSATRHWQIVSHYGVTSFGSVATMLTMLLRAQPEGVPRDCSTSRLRFALCGSAPVPAEVLRRFETRFACPVIEGYGLSEGTCRSTFNPPNERRRPGSVGLPIGNEMKVVDDAEDEVPNGTPGEIVLRGENVMKGYFKNPDATGEALRGGWLHSGDIGYRDDNGYYYIIDRKSDMIIRGGENIYPREIDEVLYRHPKVQDAATIGIPDPLYGEEVKAFVVLKQGETCTEDELLMFCRQRLADYKSPKTVEFLGEIPKGPTGKLLKRALTARSFRR